MASAGAIAIGSAIASTGTSVYYNEQKRKKEKKLFADQNKRANEQAKISKKIEKKNMEIAERERKNLLKRKIASQKAMFGGAGVGNSGASNYSLIDGYRKESKQGIEDKRQFSNLKLQGIDSGLAYENSRNLLKQDMAASQSLYKNVSSGIDLGTTIAKNS